MLNYWEGRSRRTHERSETTPLTTLSTDHTPGHTTNPLDCNKSSTQTQLSPLTYSAKRPPHLMNSITQHMGTRARPTLTDTTGGSICLSIYPFIYLSIMVTSASGVLALLDISGS